MFLRFCFNKGTIEICELYITSDEIRFFSQHVFTNAERQARVKENEYSIAHRHAQGLLVTGYVACRLLQYTTTAAFSTRLHNCT